MMPQGSSSTPAGSLTSEQIDAAWSIDNAAEGVAKLKSLVAGYPASEDELRTQIARSLGLQRRFDEAWEEIANISKSAPELVQVRVHLESGRLKNTAGDGQGSRIHFQHALALAEKQHFDYYAVDAAHMMGIITEGEESVLWNERALQLAANSKDKRAQKWKGSLLNNLGWTRFGMLEFEKALTNFESALAFQMTLGNPVQIRIAQWTVARCLRALGRHREAFAIQSDLIQYPEQGYVSEELGEILLAMGRLDEAKPRFRRAYELLSSRLLPIASEAPRLARLKQLGKE